MAPKRPRNDPKQPSLEEVAEKPSTKKRSKKGDLAHPEVKASEDSIEDLRRRKLSRKHQEDPSFQEKEPATKSKADSAKDDSKEDKKPSEAIAGAKEPITINRAPVLTLWVSVVAQQEGYSRASGLTFGKAIAGILAQSKGQSIGVFEKKDKDNSEAKGKQNAEDEEAGIHRIEVFGMTIKAVKVDGEYRATESSSADGMKPENVDRYLKRAFGDRLDDAETSLGALAKTFSKEEIGNEAYHLYEQFRPQVASGKSGWGKKGELDLKQLEELHSK